MRLVLILLWCLRWLPMPWVRAIGRALGRLLFRFGRRRVTLTNLRACFPELSEGERVAIGRRVFERLASSALDLGWLWYAPVETALSRIRMVDFHHMEALRGQTPVILLVPHFSGLDFGGAAFSHAIPEAFAMYSAQKNKVFDAALRRARKRYADAELVTRQQGLRPVLKGLKARRPFFYLPDMDFGARDAVFVDFFGVKTATITTLSRLCAISGAKVVPMIATQTDSGYDARFYPAWENFPSGDDVADARRMNAFLEERVREAPDQYFWVHKRFKTRPPGEPGFYE